MLTVCIVYTVYTKICKHTCEVHSHMPASFMANENIVFSKWCLMGFDWLIDLNICGDRKRDIIIAQQQQQQQCHDGSVLRTDEENKWHADFSCALLIHTHTSLQYRGFCFWFLPLFFFLWLFSNAIELFHALAHKQYKCLLTAHLLFYMCAVFPLPCSLSLCSSICFGLFFSISSLNELLCDGGIFFSFRLRSINSCFCGCCCYCYALSIFPI